MYLIYNREYKLVGEAKDFTQVQDIIGDDIDEGIVDSLKFVRGKTVISVGEIKRLVHKIVSVEKAEVVDYITEEVESQEDVTVELKTANRQLSDKLEESRGYLVGLSNKIGELAGDVNLDSGLSSVGDAKMYTDEIDEGDYLTVDNDSFYKESEDVSVKEDVAEPKGLDNSTLEMLEDVERNRKTKVTAEKSKSASSVIPNRRKRGDTSINFINIIDGGKVKQIKDLKGKSMVKTSKLSQVVGLDREHIEFLIDNVLRDCGGAPKFQNKNVVSPAEAVWIIVSALTKRDGFSSSQRFQKTKENAEDFYQSWESQKDEINDILK